MELKVVLKSGFVATVTLEGQEGNPVDMYREWARNASDRPFATLELPGIFAIQMSEIAAIFKV